MTRITSAVVTSIVALLILSLVAQPAEAETCDATPSSVLETFPASGSRDAPINGLALVVYCPPEDAQVPRLDARLLVEADQGELGCLNCEDLGDECLEVARQDMCLRQVPASVTLDGDRVQLETPEPFLPWTTYVIEAPSVGGPVRVAFTTGTRIDDSPPSFDGIEQVRIHGCGPGFSNHPGCPSGEGDEGFLATLRAFAGQDDSGSVNLEYLAFQQRGQGIVQRGRSRGDGASDVTMSVYISLDDLEGSEIERLCFFMTAIDLFGHESLPSGATCTTTPEYSPFSSACSTAKAGADQWVGWLALLVGWLALRTPVRAQRARRDGRSG